MLIKPSSKKRKQQSPQGSFVSFIRFVFNSKFKH